MRASDADRERAVLALRDHYGAGRLREAELDVRVADAFSARTHDELGAVLADLPRPADPATRAPAPRTRRTLTTAGRWLRTSVLIHAVVYLVVNAGLVAIWLLAGGETFWPAWVLVGWGIGLGAHWAPLAAGVGRRTIGEAPAVALLAERERPSLRGAAAADGTVTILFTDIVDSTAHNRRLGDERWLELLRRHHRIVRDAVSAGGGHEVKVQGDGFMLAFARPDDAVGCAREVRRRLGEGLEGAADRVVEVRIGVHVGQAVREEADFYGVNVALAARVAAEAGPGEILVSSSVREALDDEPGLAFGTAREVQLKGLGAHHVHPVAG